MANRVYQVARMFRERGIPPPYDEDEAAALRDLIGTERILFGSDFPHAEGLADPVSYALELQGFSPAEVEQVMRSNAPGLVGAA